MDVQERPPMERLTKLEERVHALEMTTAVWRESKQYLDFRFGALERGLTEMRADQKRLMWVVVVGIIGGILQFIFRGGMAP